MEIYLQICTLYYNMDWIKQSHIYMKHVKVNIYPTNLLLLSVRMVGWSTWSMGPRCWSCDVGIIPQIQSRAKVTKVTAAMGEGDDLCSVQMMLDCAANPTHTPP